MVPQKTFLFDTKKVSSLLGDEVCEAYLSRFLTFEQGSYFLFNQGKSLSVIVREAIPLNEFVRRL